MRRQTERAIPWIMAVLPLLLVQACAPMPQSDLRKDDSLSLVLGSPGGATPTNSNLASRSLSQVATLSDSGSKYDVVYGDSYQLDDNVREFKWQFARSVRFTAADLESKARLDGRFSPAIIDYLKTLPEVSPADVNKTDMLQINVRWKSADGNWNYQFITSRLSWVIERSADRQAFRIVDPHVTIYGGAPWVDKRDTSLGKYTVTFAVSIDYAGTPSAVAVGNWNATVDRIALEKVAVGQGGQLIPAFDEAVAGSPSWLTDQGHNYAFHVHVSETGS
jgi:hypothetical protein